MINNFLYDIDGYSYIASDCIKVFPCGYRGQNGDGDPLDLESQLNTEQNYRNICGAISQTYVKNKTNNTIEFYLQGYYFKITVPVTVPSGAGVLNSYFGEINLAEKTLYNSTTTTVLSSYIPGASLDYLLDGKYVFTGLRLGTSIPTTYSTKKIRFSEDEKITIDNGTKILYSLTASDICVRNSIESRDMLATKSFKVGGKTATSKRIDYLEDEDLLVTVKELNDEHKKVILELEKDSLAYQMFINMFPSKLEFTFTQPTATTAYATNTGTTTISTENIKFNCNVDYETVGQCVTVAPGDSAKIVSYTHIAVVEAKASEEEYASYYKVLAVPCSQHMMKILGGALVDPDITKTCDFETSNFTTSKEHEYDLPEYSAWKISGSTALPYDPAILQKISTSHSVADSYKSASIITGTLPFTVSGSVKASLPNYPHNFYSTAIGGDTFNNDFRPYNDFKQANKTAVSQLVTYIQSKTYNDFIESDDDDNITCMKLNITNTSLISTILQASRYQEISDHSTILCPAAGKNTFNLANQCGICVTMLPIIVSTDESTDDIIAMVKNSEPGHTRQICTVLNPYSRKCRRDRTETVTTSVINLRTAPNIAQPLDLSTGGDTEYAVVIKITSGIGLVPQVQFEDVYKFYLQPQSAMILDEKYIIKYGPDIS